MAVNSTFVNVEWLRGYSASAINRDVNKNNREVNLDSWFITGIADACR